MSNDLELRFEATDILEKSIGGKTRRILGGYAAGTTRDFQDEKFLMKGMNFDYLNSPQGKINWDHQQRLIIGRPLEKGIAMTGNGLYVKGMLSERSDFVGSHKDVIEAMDIADWAWDHALRHKADPEGVIPLAWSVEGKKMNRGNMIVKSIVTDVALTDKAVNPNDCTVSAMAKSLREEIKTEEIDNVSVISGLTIDEIEENLKKIKDGESFIIFCKSIGLPAEQSFKFFNIMRGL
jgi:hypothetical protein